VAARLRLAATFYLYTIPMHEPLRHISKKPNTCSWNDYDHSHHKHPGTFEHLVHAEMTTAQSELERGLAALNCFEKSVTIYGSARLKEGHPSYEQARIIAARLCELGYTIITGGGPGIMEAANRGAFETCGSSVGFNIELPSEQVLNKYATHGVSFKYFFTRKVALSFASQVYLAFPGGFGTFDEIFEQITLIQTGKSPHIPVILVGSAFWGPFDALIKKIMVEEYGTVSTEETQLYTILDDTDAIVKHILEAPIRNKYREIESQENVS
jgi:uncharacterized protein (TIGR00730 family)